MIMLSVGVVGLIIGGGLFFFSFSPGAAKLRTLGGSYLAVSLLLIGLRPILEQISHARRHRHRRHGSHGSQSDLSPQAPAPSESSPAQEHASGNA
jgi:hypothetical protein